MDDVERLRAGLRTLEPMARTQAWDDTRPWRVGTHVGWSNGLPTIDGHAMSAKLMKRALDVVEDLGPSLDTGAVRVVTGVGRHSHGPGSALRQIVQSRGARLADTHGWSTRPQGSAAYVVVIDPAKAPASARGPSDLGLWLLGLGLLAAAVVALAHGFGLI